MVFLLLKYTVFCTNIIKNRAFVDYISPNLLIRNMQFIGVSVLINDKIREFCFLSLGDGFVLIDYVGVRPFLFVWVVFTSLEFQNVSENIITLLV